MLERNSDAYMKYLSLLRYYITVYHDDFNPRLEQKEGKFLTVVKKKKKQQGETSQIHLISSKSSPSLCRFIPPSKCYFVLPPVLG